jgi:hypothetical protein
MPDDLGTLFPSSVIGVEYVQIHLKLLMRSFMLAMYFPELKLGRYLYPMPLGNPV